MVIPRVPAIGTPTAGRIRAAAILVVALIVWVVSGPMLHAAPPSEVTVVMVHGAWADPSSWDGEAAVLERDGFQVRTVANPLRNLITDASSVAAFLHTIDGPVVLVGHSYGGSVITQAADSCPNVHALVFVDAYAPDIGESASMLNGGGSVVLSLPEDQLFDAAPDPAASDGSMNLRLKRDVFLDDFASDLPRPDATRLWATQQPTSTDALKTANTAAAWKTIPSWAFISTGDRIITPDAKTAMAERAHATVTTFPDGSHLSLISHPDAVAAVIESAVAAVS
ncbi:alpha/beta fold hydrolase [Mycolicibacterium brisbanense]